MFQNYSTMAKIHNNEQYKVIMDRVEELMKVVTRERIKREAKIFGFILLGALFF